MKTRVRRLLLLGTMLAGLPALAHAEPSGPTVTSGSVEIETTGSVTTIRQGSDRSVIEWERFSIDAGETTRFLMPSASSLSLNRVTGGDPSRIFGTLTSNGQVWLINPSGILFGASARVDVAGLVASSIDIPDSRFLAGIGRYGFGDAGLPVGDAGSVENLGTITVADTGYAALIAPHVANAGTIVAPSGRLALGGARAVTLDLYGDRLLQFQAPLTANDIQGDGPLASNEGTLWAAGGSVQIAAAAIPGLVQNVVNTEGVVRADSISRDGGKVVLSAAGGATTVGGRVSATSDMARGGDIEVLGDAVAVRDGSEIDASGATGGGRIRIGGGRTGGEGLQRASVTHVAATAQIRADATVRGDGGDIVVWSDDLSTVHGRVSARGGPEGGDGGDVEVSSKGHLDFAWRTDVAAPLGVPGELLIDPASIEICDACGPTDTPPLTDGLIFEAPTDVETTRFSASEIEDAINSNARIIVQARDTDGSSVGDGNIVLNADLVIDQAGLGPGVGPGGGGPGGGGPGGGPGGGGPGGGPPGGGPGGGGAGGGGAGGGGAGAGGGGGLSHELLFQLDGDMIINGNITITSPYGLQLTIHAEGDIIVNGQITATSGVVVLNGRSVTVNTEPNVTTAELKVIERGTQTLDEFLDENGRRHPGRGSRGLAFNDPKGRPRPQDRAPLQLREAIQTASSASSAVRLKFATSDAELTTAAAETEDTELQGLVEDILDILEEDGQRAGDGGSAQPFGGDAKTIVPGLLSYDPTAPGSAAARARAAAAVDSAPVLFGGLPY